jgi:hypothetical protein
MNADETLDIIREDQRPLDQTVRFLKFKQGSLTSSNVAEPKRAGNEATVKDKERG